MEKNTKQKMNERFKSLNLKKKVIILIILIVIFIGSIILNNYLSHRREERFNEQQSLAYQEPVHPPKGAEDGTVANIEDYFKNETETQSNNTETPTE